MDIPCLLTRSLIIVVIATAITGCGTFNDFLANHRLTAPPLLPVEERPRLEPINREYFVLESAEQTLIGEPQVVFTREQDTFSDLAREYGLGYEELVAANPDIDPWLPGDQTPVLLPTQYILPYTTRKGIVLNVASMRLFYFPPLTEGETQRVMTYPIGIGRVGWKTPLGATSVIAKAQNPSWYVPKSVRKEHAALGDPLPRIVPPGPDNPLGLFTLKLDMPGYLIHGTNKPYGVGMRVSHGCVRLYPENIETLYSLATKGDPVEIVNEPYMTAWKDGELYLESHLPLDDDTISPHKRLQDVLDTVRRESSAFSEASQVNLAQTITKNARGVPIKILPDGSHEKVFDRARVVKNTVGVDSEAPTLTKIQILVDNETPENQEIL